MFTWAYHWSLSCARWSQSITSHPISLRCILILFSHQCLSLLNGIFPSEFLTKTLYAFLPCVLHALANSTPLIWYPRVVGQKCSLHILREWIQNMTRHGSWDELRHIKICQVFHKFSMLQSCRSHYYQVQGESHFLSINPLKR